MRRTDLIALILLAVACSGDGEENVVAPSAADGGSANEAGSVFTLPPGCEDAASPPATLRCTGLYADTERKQLALGVRPYAPGVVLWSDGAHKERWVWLPPGTTIDATNPNEWLFPVGTRFWKEFSRDGRRVETRLWQKVRAKFWVGATYAWNAEETEALLTAGGDISFHGSNYHIPTGAECDKCHRGRTDNILGFEQVGLGLPGATGITLADLVAEGRIVPAPASTSLSIGDDGSGAAAPALAWLHMNCGVTCHSRNSNATAYGSGLRLRLDATLLDGRSVADFDALKTTQNIAVNAPGWEGQIRIVPGDPERSLLYSLISHRGPNIQMPPIASDIVDEVDVALVQAWIRGMAPPSMPDAGLDVADAGAPDSGTTDVVDSSVTPIEAAPEPDVPDAASPADVRPDASEVPETGTDAGAPPSPDAEPVAPEAATPDAGSGDTPDAADAADAGAAVGDAGDDAPPRDAETGDSDPGDAPVESSAD